MAHSEKGLPVMYQPSHWQAGLERRELHALCALGTNNKKKLF